jgi:hypothetical protein
MTKQPELPILDARPSSTRRIDRRQWIERMLSGVTAGLAFPRLAAAHPVHKHLGSAATLDQAEAQAAAANWKPEFLDPHQTETLAVLAERIVPGSSHGQVERFIDTLLSVDTRENQQRFLNSLAAVEGAALERYGHPFQDLTEAQQNELLTAASTTEPGGEQAHQPVRRRRGSRPATAAGGPNKESLRDHFENLKGWVVGAYYSSEAGMKELGWTGEVAFDSYPGCEHPGGHA